MQTIGCKEGEISPEKTTNRESENIVEKDAGEFFIVYHKNR